MRIFCIGDIVSMAGRKIISENLEYFKEEKHIDLIIANGENASHGRGMTRKVYDELMSYGIEGFTMGNNILESKDIFSLLKYTDNIARPANFEMSAPGTGHIILGGKVGVINLIGRVYMEGANSPFTAVDREIKSLKAKGINIILVDFHAEATSEKKAMGWYLDGKVSAVFGTHTHVQTADEMIMPNGTGYITDIGMTGAIYSVLGRERTSIINRFVTGLPQKHEIADGKSEMCGIIFDIDEESGKTTGIERTKIV